ncbi:MAG: methyltransferase domain-containing protein [Alphaproteobacteria bacterium]|nr:methyltransferase domain-containing protein [Alphaproteobacteria bacterium]
MSTRDQQNTAATLRRAIAFHKQGRLEEAVAAYREAIDDAPALPPAHYNLAVALRALGRPLEALVAVAKAVRADPSYALATILLADLNVARGKPDKALAALLAAYEHSPSDVSLKRRLVSAFAEGEFTRPDRRAEAALVSLLDSPGLDYQRLAQAGMSLLRAKRSFARAIERRHHLDAAEMRQLAELALFRELLAKTIIAAADFEALIGALRRIIAPILADPNEPPEAALVEFGAALALLCNAVEYVYDESIEESSFAAALRDRSVSNFAPWLVALALYRPFRARRSWPELARIEPPGRNAQFLWQRLVHQPLAERKLAADIPILTPITVEANGGVREQYEENPYPRWLSAGIGEARRLDEVVGSLFPQHRPQRSFANCRILIAGCGTGQHAVRTAMRYTGAEVTAIDLSRASLAYAKRQAEALGLSHIRFAHADIARLGSLAESYDLIEVSGVLMCLAEPVEGWRTLSRLLAPRGYMRVGLYSVQARQDVAIARSLAMDYPRTLAGIRAARAALRALPTDHPAAAVTRLYDFFTTSSCRDLFMAAREIPFTIPEIAAALETLDLEFLGFEALAPATSAAYRQRYADDPDLTNLAHWHEFELDHPFTFRTMYQLWCQARA